MQATLQQTEGGQHATHDQLGGGVTRDRHTRDGVGANQLRKTGYYVALGDSVAAGEGAMPVTHGYAYQLYEQGVFGQKQRMDFANMGLRGGRSWDLRDHQVAQVLCAEPA